MNQIKNIKWKQIRWILLGCIPLFFFLRGIHLILTGGGWIATINQPIHWFLLFLEISISCLAIFGCFILWYTESYVLKNNSLYGSFLIKIITVGIFFTFIIHFIRVGFWIQNSVL